MYYKVDFKIKAEGYTEDARGGLMRTACDLLAALSADAGFEAFEDTPCGMAGYVQAQLFDRGALDNAIASLPLIGVSVEYSMSLTEDKDYNAEWELTGFEPVIIRDKIVIHDAVHPAPPVSDGVIEITIDTKQAFGTGSHETTRMVLECLADMNLRGKDVLDCGCGTGILSVAASKLGARRVVGFDIDGWSVRNTAHNALINDANNIEALHGDACVMGAAAGTFDIVMANISRNILLDGMPALRRAMGRDGTLVISGFYEEDAETLISRAEATGLRCKGKAVDNRWCMLLLVPADA